MHSGWIAHLGYAQIRLLITTAMDGHNLTGGVMYLENLAIEYLTASGERTASRLKELVEHLAGVYGSSNDSDGIYQRALTKARKTVFDFKANE